MLNEKLTLQEEVNLKAHATYYYKAYKNGTTANSSHCEN